MSNERRRIWKDPIIASTVVIAIATVINIAISTLLWLTTRDSVRVAEASVEITQKVFKAANRPYIGVADSLITLDKTNERLGYSIEVKNYGTVEARSVVINLESFVSNQPQQQSGHPEMRSGVLSPTKSVFVGGEIVDAVFRDVIESGNLFKVKVTVKYVGVSGETLTFIQELLYHPASNRFMNTFADSY